MFLIVSFLLVPFTNAIINGDLNCTTYNGTAFVYSPSAVVCSNTLSDAACKALYVAPDTDYPEAGNSAERALACYTTSSSTPAAIVEDMKTAALETCAKTCGLCCQTSAYDCPNAIHPRLHCDTITISQCRSLIWRTIIAEDCPSACGFCNDGGCVDAVVDCAVDTSICTTIGMQDFVNTYCQKTCGRCSSSSTSSSTVRPPAPPPRSCGDASGHCAAWAKNGYCTNSFYTVNQRRAYCGATCNLC